MRLPGWPKDIITAGDGKPAHGAAAVERAAALGNAEAQYYRGVCCFYGDGVPRDKEAAFRLWEQAAEQGHVGACRSLETLRGRES